MKDQMLNATVESAIVADYNVYSKKGWTDLTLDEYRLINELTYSTLIFSYTGLITDLAQRNDVNQGSLAYRTVIPYLACGIYNFNRTCETTWDSLLHPVDVTKVTQNVLTDLINKCSDTIEHYYEAAHYILRYTKRFLPNGVTAGKNETFETFMSNMVDMDKFNHEVHGFIVGNSIIYHPMHTQVIQRICDKWHKLDELIADNLQNDLDSLFRWDSHVDHMLLPDGNDFEGHATQLEKYNCTTQYIPNYFLDDSIIQKDVVCDNYRVDDCSLDSYDGLLHEYRVLRNNDDSVKACHDIPFGKDLNVVSSKQDIVPKNYCKSRIIAKEHCHISVINGHLMETLLKVVSNYFGDVNPLEALEDKIWPQTMMISNYEDYGTADFSSASDRLALELVKGFLPLTAEVLNQYRASYMITEGGLLELPIWSTMGSRQTMPLQALCYYFIDDDAFWQAIRYEHPNRQRALKKKYAATLQVSTATDSGEEILSTEVLITKVLGDDTQVPCFCFETFIDIATSCGLKVNYAKSYAGDTNICINKDFYGYRETCGAELIFKPHKHNAKCPEDYIILLWCYAKDNEALYYPRTAIANDWPSALSLIERQHDMARRDLHNASSAIAQCIRSMEVAFVNRKAKVLLGSLIKEDYITTGQPLTIWKPFPMVEDPRCETLSFLTSEGSDDQNDVQVSRNIAPHYGIPAITVVPVFQVGRLSDSALRSLANIQYNLFLLGGPSYSDELCELVGCSEPMRIKQQWAGRMVGYEIHIEG